MEVYNTIARRKQAFQPKEPGKVGIYVCGPTTYNYIHLGNARPLVFFDTVRRYFKYKDYDVTYVQNFTDMDDKIINRAGEEGIDPLALSRKYIDEYYKDADSLNVRRADKHPKVSEHIPEIITMVEQLVKNGTAYVIDGDVYFEVRKFAGYGKLSGRNPDDMKAGARIDVDERKRDPMDFALWKAAKTGEPSWDSPWGPGRPGWHIECSAMSLKYLGTNFDIHGGGHDLVFPHHENEIAQSEAATGESFVRYWMHNGFITVNEEKMSKSLGNFFLVRDILAKYPPELVRFFLLSTHYRSPLDFDDEKLAAAGRGLERIKTSVRLLKEALEKPAGQESTVIDSGFSSNLDSLKGSFEAAMDDDFNTALAIGVIFDLAREVNSITKRLGPTLSPTDRALLLKAMELFKMFNEVMGFFKVASNTGDMLLDGVSDKSQGLAEGLISLIIEVRQEARKNKNWTFADRIRDGLKELGIVLEDTPQGVRWKKQG
ncbi:MAG: Cysteine--tRNA ligase [Pelotomaculum sp. PtaB.Bin104]|nr:MAG: Cysteine--tRNA ligase [Pelotomaculum sp. PtaB.Bin104]